MSSSGARVGSVFLVAAVAASAAGRAEAGILYNQPANYPNTFNALTSQNQASGAGFQTFDNFTLATGGLISSISWQGLYWNPFTQTPNVPPAPNTNDFQIGFFQNQNNLPGALIGSAILLTDLQSSIVGQASFGPDTSGNLDLVNVVNFKADLATPFNASAGQTLWLSIVSFASNYPPGWLWTSGSGGDGISAQLAYGASSAVHRPGDRTFLLSTTPLELGESEPPTSPPIGRIADVPEPGTLALAAVGLCCGALARIRRRSRA